MLKGMFAIAQLTRDSGNIEGDVGEWPHQLEEEFVLKETLAST